VKENWNRQERHDAKEEKRREIRNIATDGAQMDTDEERFYLWPSVSDPWLNRFVFLLAFLAVQTSASYFPPG
jgi:hypothetical protein